MTATYSERRDDAQGDQGADELVLGTQVASAKVTARRQSVRQRPWRRERVWAQRAGAKAVGGLEVRARSGERERRRRAVPPDARRTPGTAAGARRRREGSNSEDEQGDERPGALRPPGPSPAPSRWTDAPRPTAQTRLAARGGAAHAAARDFRADRPPERWCAHGRCRRRALGGAAGASSRGGPTIEASTVSTPNRTADRLRTLAVVRGWAVTGRFSLGVVGPPPVTAGNRTGSVQWW